VINQLYYFFERMLFEPRFYHYPIIFLLLPFSFLYSIIVTLLFPKKYEDLGIPIVSVGNIILGGSGKTPFSIALANYFEHLKPVVILRGYGRKSKGLIVVSKEGEILTDIDSSGDEAMEIALKTKAGVIVAENRKEAILEAKKLGAGFVILDDGFNKPFKKLNIVLDIEIKNPFCLPAGGYRYPKRLLKYADMVLKQQKDFKRVVNVPRGDILISGISKPDRLLKYVKSVSYKFFPDHYDYKKEDLEEFKNKTIITTMKDYVKLKKFDLKLEVMELKIEINENILKQIEQYLIK